MASDIPFMCANCRLMFILFFYLDHGMGGGGRDDPIRHGAVSAKEVEIPNRTAHSGI